MRRKRLKFDDSPCTPEEVEEALKSGEPAAEVSAVRCGLGEAELSGVLEALQRHGSRVSTLHLHGNPGWGRVALPRLPALTFLSLDAGEFEESALRETLRAYHAHPALREVQCTWFAEEPPEELLRFLDSLPRLRVLSLPDASWVARLAPHTTAHLRRINAFACSGDLADVLERTPLLSVLETMSAAGSNALASLRLPYLRHAMCPALQQLVRANVAALEERKRTALAILSLKRRDPLWALVARYVRGL